MELESALLSSSSSFNDSAPMVEPSNHEAPPSSTSQTLNNSQIESNTEISNEEGVYL